MELKCQAKKVKKSWIFIHKYQSHKHIVKQPVFLKIYKYQWKNSLRKSIIKWEIFIHRSNTHRICKIEKVRFLIPLAFFLIQLCPSRQWLFCHSLSSIFYCFFRLSHSLLFLLFLPPLSLSLILRYSPLLISSSSSKIFIPLSLRL